MSAPTLMYESHDATNSSGEIIPKEKQVSTNLELSGASHSGKQHSLCKVDFFEMRNDFEMRFIG
jgi:hypothetical protein